MTRDIDGWDIAAQIRLMRQVHKGSFLIVEGETDDKALSRYIDSNACEIEVAFGKQNALQALDLLEEDGFAGVVALVDADFDRLLSNKYPVENLYITDKHDLDLTIFASSAFDQYVREYSDRESLNKVCDGDLIKLRQWILSSALPLACCRLASDRDSLNIYFKDLRHDSFIREDDLILEVDHLLSALIGRSKTRCDIAGLKSRLAREAALEHDLYQLVSGHDAAAVFGIALRKLLGDRRDVHTWSSEIEAGLRLAFNREALEETEFYISLRAWEGENIPYCIFVNARGT
jgi:hypothetical protein